MTWLVAIGLALLALGLAARLTQGAPRAAAPVAAALVLGLGGYALQVRPDLPGAPWRAAAPAARAGADLVRVRHKLRPDGAPLPDRWTVIADALARNGGFGDAAGVVLGAVERDPSNADAWVALANNLVAHADGTLTPAADYAYRRAAEADPASPGPDFFLGLALAGNGQPDRARSLWRGLLARAPADAPWRAELDARLRRLDTVVAAQPQVAR